MKFQTQKIIIGVILILTFIFCLISLIFLSANYNNTVSIAANDADANTEFLKNIIKHY